MDDQRVVTPAPGASSGCLCAEVTEEEKLAQLDDILAQYRDVPGGLIPVLQMAQAIFGYLPEPVLKRIARAFGKPLSEVTGVVTFYSFFNTVPRGRHMIRVCLGTACYVRGGKQVLAALREELGIDVGETTSDRSFSLDVGRCFGACGLAPVIMIDNDVHQRVKVSRLGELLRKYRNGDK
ncbi:NAD(P)H-dependent oxidoreductase subunit E [Thermogutta sp.]|uniref:NADH-quinone oxidoreductase subunit NuoE family protein n=1 Tax=Thermogutta sp. TaxID=1962930 RepID=UPI0032209707